MAITAIGSPYAPIPMSASCPLRPLKAAGLTDGVHCPNVSIEAMFAKTLRVD